MSICTICQEREETIPDNIFKTTCGHFICFNCFNYYISDCKQYPPKCFRCYEFLTDEECEENVCDEVLQYFRETRSHFICINSTNKYPCFNAECSGIYIHDKEEELLTFICPQCNKKTCLRCKDIHDENETCEEWEGKNQELIISQKALSKENKRQIRAGLSMRCVNCKAMVQKLEGCDGVLCPVCLTGLCFKTKQARWGPNGDGDYSGGCGCRQDNKTKCHPRCKGCTVHPLVDLRKDEATLNDIQTDIEVIQHSGRISPLFLSD